MNAMIATVYGNLPSDWTGLGNGEQGRSISPAIIIVRNTEFGRMGDARCKKVAPPLPLGLIQEKAVGVPITESIKSVLFTPLKIRDVTFNNRIVVSPMCMYSCASQDGIFTDFHLAHIGTLALRGPAIVFIEATAVLPNGRLSPQDTGLWNDDQGLALSRIVQLTKASNGAKIGIQLAHGGRKSSTYPPFHMLEENGGRLGRGIVPNEAGGWAADIVAPSAMAWKEDGEYPTPNEMTIQQIKTMVAAWGSAAARAVRAGVEVIEVHGAHGYLIHEFLSGNTNHRKDEYGGSFDNRIRFLLEIITEVRAKIPNGMPLFCRLSGTDYAGSGGEQLAEDKSGWDIFQVTELCKRFVPLGVDVVDISSGGNLSTVTKGIMGPNFGFQLPLANHVKQAQIPGLLVVAVGSLQNATKANQAVLDGQTDFVGIGRHFLKDPNWIYTAAEELGVDIRWPAQYSWMWPKSQ